MLTTWTASEQSMNKADEVRAAISPATEGFRHAVREYYAAIRSLFGNGALLESLEALPQLPRPTPGPPNGLLADEQKVRDIYDTMYKTPDSVFVTFAARSDAAQDQTAGSRFSTQCIPEEHLLAAAQVPACMPFIDALHEHYPEAKP
ncbi:hypothetical protein CAC42_1214 [Sphaceloma murrayae]|uniref:Uncharacterized protein n=1 Tax=Sphaceloma murrayae TaxID=2082308 RepID=A0A2K1R2D2_9PEZI|nr:hypothetical protein CAC42_1214 [Sphaceloma murrayae]